MASHSGLGAVTYAELYSKKETCQVELLALAAQDDKIKAKLAARDTRTLSREEKIELTAAMKYSVAKNQTAKLQLGNICLAIAEKQSIQADSKDKRIRKMQASIVKTILNEKFAEISCNDENGLLANTKVFLKGFKGDINRDYEKHSVPPIHVLMRLGVVGISMTSDSSERVKIPKGMIVFEAGECQSIQNIVETWVARKEYAIDPAITTSALQSKVEERVKEMEKEENAPILSTNQDAYSSPSRVATRAIEPAEVSREDDRKGMPGDDTSISQMHVMPGSSEQKESSAMDMDNDEDKDSKMSPTEKKRKTEDDGDAEMKDGNGGESSDSDSDSYSDNDSDNSGNRAC